jgi:hypothetical protein
MTTYQVSDPATVLPDPKGRCDRGRIQATMSQFGYARLMPGTYHLKGGITHGRV